MQTPALPLDEIERVAALHAMRILDTPAEETFDRITRLAAEILKTPIALISLVDSKRQWFKSTHGIAGGETSREISFCGHAILSPGVFVVHDALLDARFVDNPAVTGAPYVRFYAGVPLRCPQGYALGTLCCVDSVPRSLTAAELAALRDLGSAAEEMLQQRQIAASTKDLLRSMQEREERYRHLIEQSPDAFFIHSDGILDFVNGAGLALLGADRLEQIVGQPAEMLAAPEYLELARQRTRRALDEGLDAPLIEQAWMRLDGTRVYVEVKSIPFVLGGKKAVQLIARDITERKREKLELERLSTNDILTGLPNRALLMDRLHQGILRWQRRGQNAVVAFFDLDHFQTINDMFGYSAGDQALLAAAKSLIAWLRQSDTAARIGGDQFVLILEDMQSDEIPPAILQRIFEQVSQPVWISNQQIALACSIGYCKYPDDGADPNSLLNAAQAAMYHAKELGRANIQRYTRDMRPQTSERLVLEHQLRDAVERGELLLHYQPKVSLQSGCIVGVEALIRWQHPGMGMVAPVRFIPIAEESGLIVPIGEWIIRTACEQARQWQGTPLADMSIAINLSARQFLQPDIVDCVTRAVAAAGIDPRILEFELTESMAMASPEKSISIMNAFKDLGVALSVDDFGTGYSNLSHLNRFPVNKLKIDRSFIRDIAHSPEALTIVQVIIGMAHRLRMTVVAEGVETAEQLSLLAQHDCDEMQGFYFSRPMPAADCTRFMLSAPRMETGWQPA
jgi:diguanylate cyclase (GGDEF)-like protein/PAS domain S-box-containing protein